jgi:nucleotide-binding universal stress UspA family protein
MSQPVLVAIDLAHPEHSKPLLSRAAQLATLDEAPLAVMSVVPDFGMSIVGSYFKDGSQAEALEQARAALHSLVEEALGAAAGIQHIIAQGSAYEQILTTADQLNARLIVMGAHKPEFQDFLLGPNAARVVRHAKTSVLVVRDA